MLSAAEKGSWFRLPQAKILPFGNKVICSGTMSHWITGPQAPVLASAGSGEMVIGGLFETVAPAFFPEGTDPAVVDVARSIAVEQKQEDLVRAIAAIRDRPDSTEALTGAIPLLFVVGDSDPLASPEYARDIAAAAQNGRAEVFENTGHLPNLQRPNEFNRLLTEFLASL